MPTQDELHAFLAVAESAARNAGNDFKVGLIGPGVASSHSTERTHKKGVEATVELCLAYIAQF